MADHKLSIEFSGDFSKLRTQLEQEKQQAQAKLGTVQVGGAAPSGGPPGVSREAQQAVGNAFERIDQRRVAREAGTARPWFADDREMSPVLRSARNESGRAEARADDRRRFREANENTDRRERALAAAERAEIRATQASASGGGGNGDFPVIVSPSDSDGGPPGAGRRRNRIASSRFGDGTDANLISRFGSALSVGYVTRQAARAVGAQLELSREMTLAGRNQDQQLAAILKHNEAVAPLGEIGQTWAEQVKSAFYGRDVSRLGTTLMARSAAQTEERSQAIAENRIRLAGINASVGSVGAANEFDKARAQAEFQRTVSAGEIQRRRQEDNEKTASAIDTDRALVEGSRAQRALDYRNKFGNTGRLGKSRNISDIESGLRIEDEAGLTRTQSDRIGRSNEQARLEREGADRLLRVTNENIGRAERASNIRLTGRITSNVLAGRNDAFGAQLNDLVSETKANISEASNDPSRAAKLFLEGYTKTFSFLAQTGRELKYATDDARASVKQNQALLSGDPIEASRIGTDAARNQKLRFLPDNDIFNALGGSALRKAINEQADSEIQVNTRNISSQLQSQYDAYQTAADVARLGAENKPLTGRVAGIAETAQGRARELARAGGFWNMQNRKLLLQTAQDELKGLENQIAFGGGAQVVSPGSTGTRFAFDQDPGNADSNEAQERTRLEIEKMRLLMQNAPLFDPTIGMGF